MYGGCAMPLAWTVLAATEKHARRDEWLRMLRQVQAAVPLMGRAVVCGLSDLLSAARGNEGRAGVTGDRSTLNRWVIKSAPECEKAFRRRQRPAGRSWRMEETDVRIKGKLAYLYRAVNKEGHTIDFLLTPMRDRDAAGAFLRKATRSPGLPEKITIEQSGSNTAAITHDNTTHRTAIVIRPPNISIPSWSRTTEP